MSRKTEQRKAIRNVLERTTRPLTPQEVLAESLHEVEGIGIATVYRNLKAFFEEGWLAKVELANEPTRYERADLAHHHHFHCKDCDRVFDLPGCRAGIKGQVPENFTLVDHSLTLIGSCAECNQKKAG